MSTSMIQRLTNEQHQALDAFQVEMFESSENDLGRTLIELKNEYYRCIHSLNIISNTVIAGTPPFTHELPPISQIPSQLLTKLFNHCPYPPPDVQAFIAIVIANDQMEQHLKPMTGGPEEEYDTHWLTDESAITPTQMVADSDGENSQKRARRDNASP